MPDRQNAPYSDIEGSRGRVVQIFGVKKKVYYLLVCPHRSFGVVYGIKVYGTFIFVIYVIKLMVAFKLSAYFSGQLIESFFDIRKTIEGLALSNYVAEVLSDVAVEEAESDLLRLSLNTLYAIAKGKYSLSKIKAVFEIRTASIIGFMPDVISCHKCHGKEGDFFFDIMGGVIECRDCRDKAILERAIPEDPHESKIITILSPGAKDAMGYSIYSPLEKIFSFNLSDDDMRLFSRAAEEYLLNQIGHSYKSLDFYKDVER